MVLLGRGSSNKDVVKELTRYFPGRDLADRVVTILSACCLMVFSASVSRSQDAKMTASEVGKTSEHTSAFLNASTSPVDCVEGTAAGYPCSGVRLLGFLPIQDLGTPNGLRLNDVWGWVDPETSKKYALVGREDGTAFVDVTDPTRPMYLGELLRPSTAQTNVWRDIKVDGYYAFIVADGSSGRRGGHGMQVFDLRRLRDVSASPVSFDADAVYTDFTVAHNLAINEETHRAYIVGSGVDARGCNAGLHIVDISDPLQPTFEGCFNDVGTGRARGGYTHDVQCVIYKGPDVGWQGREICIGSNETAISLVDVTLADAPVPISRGTYPTSAYVHQGWLTEDHRYFVQDDELDERAFSAQTRTFIWDLQDLDDPVLLTIFTSDVISTDHNLYVKGSLVYQANYSSGLRILDISDPEQPFIAGWFDTYPASDELNFEGAWTAWPFPDDNLVLVSGRREGLFLLQPSSILGTRFGSVMAMGEGDSIRLTWAMEAEFSIDSYRIDQILPSGDRVLQGFVSASSDGVSSAGSYSFSTTSEVAIAHYQVTAIGSDGAEIQSDVVPVNLVRDTHVLTAAWPNPAIADVFMELYLADEQNVRVSLHDALGREIQLIQNGLLTNDRPFLVSFSVDGLPAGTYHVRLQGDRFTDSRAVVVVR